MDISINTALERMRYALINLRALSKKHHVDLNVDFLYNNFFFFIVIHVLIKRIYMNKNSTKSQTTKKSVFFLK